MAGCRAAGPRACLNFNAVAPLVVFDGGHAVLQARDAGTYPFGLSSLLDPVRVMAAIPGQPVDFGAVGCAGFDVGAASMRKLP
ncbi:hypothetical protein NHU_03767 [Rhodovulum sulfidophilum]|uniref:Uncharacterized protein n=1 Tax=Rhodovulum sulfidophilum TaxID=35806 RepID=A0A0D6B716_RHOSU|nr:hypothetical protein NHU_03767 [Rhodovulum sulfidophilum]